MPEPMKNQHCSFLSTKQNEQTAQVNFSPQKQMTNGRSMISHYKTEGTKPAQVNDSLQKQMKNGSSVIFPQQNTMKKQRRPILHTKN